MKWRTGHSWEEPSGCALLSPVQLQRVRYGVQTNAYRAAQREARRAEILGLIASGRTLADVARAKRISRQRVHQLVHLQKEPW